MAWTHFTAPLAPGDVITREQRNELFDALDERIRAAGASGDGLHADMAAVRTSPLLTELVKHTWLGVLRTETLFAAVSRVNRRYAASALAPALFSAASFSTALQSASGFTADDIDGIQLAGAHDSSARWNAIREGIRLLAYPRIVRSSVSAFIKESQPEPTWAAVRDAALADAEGATSDEASTTTFSGALELRRTTSVFAVPPTAPYSSYSAWFFVDEYRDSPPPDDGAKAAFGGLNTSWVLTDATEKKITIGAGGSQTGNVTFDLRLRSYDESAYLDEYQPNWGGFAIVVLSEVSTLYFAPTFTHP